MDKNVQAKLNNKEAIEFLLYKSGNGEVKVDVLLKNENIWMPQKKMAELFGVKIPIISKHLKNIYSEEELVKTATVSILETVQKEGKRKIKRKIEFYNLDAIIAVGYRVNSKRATQFRIWATQILKEYVIKGFAMNDERLKDPRQIFGKDYFEEQLARIRDIRSSERRFYQKVTDIYAQCSADYNPNEKITKQFFATVQNKLHFAITGQTAAEIVTNRVSSDKINMGLTTWKNAPKGNIRKTDVTIAKNYLDEKELNLLNRIVTMYLDYADMQAQMGVVMYMKNWVEKLDAFLKFTEYEILTNAGKISHKVAEELALGEYKKFKIEQDKNYISDFDKEVKKLLKNKK